MLFPKRPLGDKAVSLSLLLLLGLTSCTPETESPPSASPTPTSYLGQLKKQLPYNLYVDAALEKIREGDLFEASRLINTSLQNFPKQPYLHIINGVLYERMAMEGYNGKLELAAIAYESALSLDPTNWYAVYFLGQLKLKSKDYREAQEYLAHALLLKPNDPIALHDLAVASYYAYDLELARASIERALKLKPKDPLFIRSAAIIFAATGEPQRAQLYLEAFKRTLNPADPDITYVMARIQDWNRAHQNPNLAMAPSPTAPAGQEEKPGEKTDKKAEATEAEAHFILDCYLLRISDEGDTTKGWNVLTSFTNNLQGLTISPRSVSHNNTKISNLGVPSPTSTFTRIFSSSISIDQLNYNLNIANATDRRIEVLGRPTISVSLNKKATFSSGDNLKGGIQGTIGGSLGDVPTGTFLEVTPTKLNDDYVILNVSLEGSLLQDFLLNTPITDQLIRIAKTKVATTLRVKMGETGMLGGMYERTDQYVKSGFPLLQDIPAVQYLFSNETSSSLRKSVLFLVTPRRADVVRKQVEEHFRKPLAERKREPSVQELLRQDGGLSWNINAVPPALITLLQRTEEFYYQFRSGDLVSPNFWGLTPNLEEQIQQISAFLYY